MYCDVDLFKRFIIFNIAIEDVLQHKLPSF